MSEPIGLPGDAVVAVLGAGTMGRGIARVAAGAGHRVVLYDTSAAAVASAQTDVNRYLDRDVERDRLERAEADAIGGRIEYTTDLSAISGAALTVEAIVENLEVKIALLRQTEELVDDDAIIATNTSSLSVTAIAAGLARPPRVAGMHFFNPAPVLPLVEIVAGAESSESTLDTLVAIAVAWGKTPVRAASTPGFIVNRVARPFYSEALRLVEERLATPLEVDEIVTGAGGFRMGPFALMDLVGLDVNLAVSKSVYEQTFHEPRFAPNQLQQAFVDAGRLGRKTGRGFYNYVDEGSETAPPRSVAPEGPITGVLVHRGGAGVTGLVQRLESAGIAINPGFGPVPGIAVGAALLWPSDGRPASVVNQLVPDLVVVALDAVLDWSTAICAAIASTNEGVLRSAASILGAAGIEARQVGDGPGLVLLRIMAQLASVAADAVLKGVATAADIDTAMRLGTNYPIGPLEWADRYGVARLVEVLDNMAEFYGEDRYRPSSLLRRVAVTGANIKEETDRA